ncbi:Histone H3 [Caligus rogercresseyi]|uniref:Histone H3 n=1 Tax=Caligus rogercresseyi TaxID=217165 RepID=A0A7T8HLD4_CALRO|nr:Histone H3 [Caligus rogercresseyi]
MSGELDILGHDGDTLVVDGAQADFFEETHELSLGGLLESHDSRSLEAEVSLKVLGDLMDESLEGQLSVEEFGAFLDLMESHGA